MMEIIVLRCSSTNLSSSQEDKFQEQATTKVKPQADTTLTVLI
jgi:hypothetical protein